MPVTRYRCAACGNLTRFDVTVTRTTRAFHHYSVGGDLVCEDEEVLAETVEEVSCRWCGHGRDVEVVERDGQWPPGGTDAGVAASGGSGEAARGPAAGPEQAAPIG